MMANNPKGSVPVLDLDQNRAREKKMEETGAMIVESIGAFFNHKASLIIRPVKGGGIDVRFKKDA